MPAQNRHVPKALTDLSVKVMQDQSVFNIGTALAPIKNVTEKTDQYFKYNEGQQFRVNDSIRAPKAPAAEIDLTELSTTSYTMRRHSVKIAVSEEEKKTSDPAVDPELDAVEEITMALLRERELEVARVFFTTTSFSANITTLSDGKWSQDTTTSTPIDDSDTALQGILQRTGQVANGLAMGRVTRDALKDNTDILDRVKWSERGIITDDILAAVMNIDKVHVGNTIHRTTDEGISATTNFMFNSQAIFFFNNPKPKIKSANLGITFAGIFGGQKPEMKRYFDDSRDSTIIELDWMYSVDLVLSISGYMFNGTN